MVDATWLVFTMKFVGGRPVGAVRTAGIRTALA